MKSAVCSKRNLGNLVYFRRPKDSSLATYTSPCSTIALLNARTLWKVKWIELFLILIIQMREISYILSICSNAFSITNLFEMILIIESPFNIRFLHLFAGLVEMDEQSQRICLN